MITALAIIAAFAVTCSLVATVFVAGTFRQALLEMSRARDRDSERRDAQLSAVLDRFQAMRWEDLAAMRTVDEPADGGFLSPEDQRKEIGIVELDEQVRWGPLSRLRVTQEQEAAEQALLAEDFPDDFQEVTDESR